jgi:hypothetical protein
MSTRNPRLSKPIRRAISPVANRGLSAAVELRHDLILVHVERQTASPTLAGAIGVNCRRRKRPRAAEEAESAAPAA